MLAAFYRFSDYLRHKAKLRLGATTKTWGDRGEDLAQRFLQRRGYTIVARNYRTPTGSGELDLVARQDDTIVFVEVKSRATDEYGAPDRAIDSGKLHRLRIAANDFLRHTHSIHRPDPLYRFDIVTVVFGANHMAPKIEHQSDVLKIYN